MIDLPSLKTGLAERPFEDLKSSISTPSPGGEGKGEGGLNCSSGRQSALMNIPAPTLPQANVGKCRLLYVNVAKILKNTFFYSVLGLATGSPRSLEFSSLFKAIQPYSSLFKTPPGGGYILLRPFVAYGRPGGDHPHCTHLRLFAPSCAYSRLFLEKKDCLFFVSHFPKPRPLFPVKPSPARSRLVQPSPAVFTKKIYLFL